MAAKKEDVEAIEKEAKDAHEKEWQGDEKQILLQTITTILLFSSVPNCG